MRPMTLTARFTVVALSGPAACGPDGNGPSAAAPGSPANEPDRSAGAVWRSFPAAGTFTYRCTNHAGMTGTVTLLP